MNERPKLIDSLPDRMIRGEEEAFNEFADIFGPRFRAFFRRRGMSEANAEDLACSCVTDVVLELRRFSPRGPGSFERWAFKLISNKHVDWIRQQGPAHEFLSDLPELPARSAAGEPREPDKSLSKSIEQALKQLDEVDAKIVSLRLLDVPYTFAEIGAVVTLNEGATRVRYHRALSRLRTLLQADPAFAGRL